MGIDNESIPLSEKVRNDTVSQPPAFTPQQLSQLVDQHRSATRTVDQRDATREAVFDILKSSTLNGFPINVQGSNLTIDPKSMMPPVVAFPPPAPAPPVPQIQRLEQHLRAIPSPSSPPAASMSAPTEAPQTNHASVPPQDTRPPLGSSMDHAYSHANKDGTRVESAHPSAPQASHSETPRSTSISPHSTSLTGAYDQRSSKSHTGKKGDPTINHHRDPHKSRNDPTTLGSTLIPVRLKRADGARTILAYLDAPTGYVVEGAVDGERAKALPASDKFYDTVDATYRGFQIVDASEHSTTRVKIFPGTIAGMIPAGFSGGGAPYIISVSGSASFYGTVYIDDDGIATSASFGIGTPPTDTDSSFSVAIGSASVDGTGVTCVNFRFSPIEFSACRMWASNPVKYTPRWA